MVCSKAFFSLLGLAACLSAADLSLLNLAMPDARFVAGVNAEQARASRLGQYILTHTQFGDDDFQKFVAMTGFDPRRDVREILVASPGGKGNRKLIVARGVYNPVKLEDAAAAHGAQSTAYKGVNLWNDPKDSDRDAFAILDGSLAIAGDPDSLKAAIDRRKAGSPALDPAILREVTAVSGLYDVWFVSMVPPSELARRMPDERLNGALQGDAFKGIQKASGGVSLREDPVKFAAQVVNATPADANSLAGGIQFLAGLMRMGQQEPGGALNSMAASLSVVTNGNVVNIAFSIPEEMLEKPPMQHRRQRRVAPVVFFQER